MRGFCIREGSSLDSSCICRYKRKVVLTFKTYLCCLLCRAGLRLGERRRCGLFSGFWRLSLRKEEYQRIVFTQVSSLNSKRPNEPRIAALIRSNAKVAGSSHIITARAILLRRTQACWTLRTQYLILCDYITQRLSADGC